MADGRHREKKRKIAMDGPIFFSKFGMVTYFGPPDTSLNKILPLLQIQRI